MREKIEVFLKTKWGALGVWVLVLYLVLVLILASLFLKVESNIYIMSIICPIIK